MKDADDVYNFPDNFLNLEVKTNNVPYATYNWLKDGKEITRNTKPKFAQFDGQILEPDTQSKEYAGIYQFVMVARIGTIRGREVKVEFTCKFYLLYKAVYSGGGRGNSCHPLEEV